MEIVAVLNRQSNRLVAIAVALSAGAALGGEVVINEIHLNPDVDSEAVEFVELFNRGETTVDVSAWSLTDGVAYTLPVGTSIPAGGYLVLAQDPVQLEAKYGANGLGPWEGRLHGRGERVTLRDSAGERVDEVDYGLGFPWPTVGDSPGYSFELLNPQLDNDLGGHWRASVTGGATAQSALLVADRATWRYRKGESAPPSDWREFGFDDSGWAEGKAPIGYDPAIALGTRFDDMRGNYLSAFLRHRFTVSEASTITALELEALYDDGFKLYLNGELVLTVNMPGGEVAHDRRANGTRESNRYEVFDVPVPFGLLKEGENVFAVHLANGNLSNSSDCFFDCRLRGVVGPKGRGPTPGRANAVFTPLEEVPPALRQLTQQPKQPRAGEPVTVSIKATDPDGVESVALLYQVVEPGSYIELEDPAYATDWTTVVMNDSGEDGDRVAGDDVWTVTLPGDVQRHRRLIRYRIVATDRVSNVVQAPYADDPQPNFAWFCYDGAPAWKGAVRPGAAGSWGETFVVPAEEMNRLPAYHLIAKKTTVEDCTWRDRSHGDEYFWRGTLVYDGRVYDHIRMRPRGGVWRYAMGKNMWKFDFNRGHDFEARDNWGRKYRTPWSKLNLGASIQQGNFNHRGEQGLFESVGFRLFQMAGVPSMHTTFVQFRIVDEAEEAAVDDQYNGDFWGVYLAIEQPNGRFLEEHGLPDGNFYKMEGGFGEPNNIGLEGPTDSSDLRDFMSAYNRNQTEGWWRAKLNLPAYFGYQAIVQAIHHYDIANGKNYFYHRNPRNDQWTVVPWDLDLTWADNMYIGGQQGGGEPFKSRVLSNFSTQPKYAGIAREFRNRVREVRDLLWNEDEAYRLLDEYARLLRGTGERTILDADRAQWDYNPIMVDSRTVNTSKAGHGRFYQQGTPTRDFAGMVQLMKNYVSYRGANSTFSLDTMAREEGLPARPTVTYEGADGFPVNGLRFRASAFGGSAFGSIRWRIARVSRAGHPSYDPAKPADYEITSTWESEGLGNEARAFTFPAVAKVGDLYRVRARYLDAQGRASHWSVPVEFTAGETDTATELVEFLRLSELMYHPAGGGGAYEYLELHNTSADLTLDLSGATFTRGIDYAFSNGTRLPPNDYLLVTGVGDGPDLDAFRAHYGLDSEVPIVGPYEGALANEGEELTLRTAAGGLVVFSFAFNDGRGWPLSAAGAGHSLIPRALAESGQAEGALDYGGNWRASAYIDGSPGLPDPATFESVRLNEVAAHTDFSDPEHPLYDSNDWVELFNRGGAEVELGSDWYLSDDPFDLRKWAFPPGTRLLPSQWLTVDEVSGFHAPITTGFGLNKAGEQVLLSYLPGTKGDRVVDAVRFEGQEAGWSWGRVPDGGDWWVALDQPSRGQTNEPFAPRPVFSEIMYHPDAQPETEAGLEYVELTGVPTGFGEVIENGGGGVRGTAFSGSDGEWRIGGDIGFAFPEGFVLGEDQRVLILGFAPDDAVAVDAFRRHYGLTEEDVGASGPYLLLGPYQGRLSNRTGRVTLEKPEAPDLPDDPTVWVTVDQVIFADQSPWPAEADGGGLSLHRINAGRVGDDPANWAAGDPSPGDPGDGPVDSDRDGMPDEWERAFNLDPDDPADAALDSDQDGLSNLEEFQAGTRPDDGASVVRIVFLGFETADSLRLVFRAGAGRPCRIESSATPVAGVWEVVTTVPAQAAEGEVELILPVVEEDDARFYRVVVE